MMIEQLLTGLLFASAISLLSYHSRFLTFDGSIAQFILGFVLLGLGGWKWTVPVLVFFVLSSLLSLVGKKRNSVVEKHFEKGSSRDAGQVLANGGVAGIITLLWFISQHDALYYAYLGSVAAATADTWGTEIGMLSRSTPVLVTTLKRVEAGRSGAVSFLGTAAGFVGAVFIWFSGLCWIPTHSLVSTFFPTVLGGLAGSLVDSIIGATLQLQYRCQQCQRITERRTHCAQQCSVEKGFLWINNDNVNLLGSFGGALAGYLIAAGL